MSLLHDLYCEGTEGFMVGKGILDGGYVNDEGKVIIGLSIMECIGHDDYIVNVGVILVGYLEWLGVVNYKQ